MEVFGLVLDKRLDENLHCLFLYLSFFHLLPVKILIFSSVLQNLSMNMNKKLEAELED